MILSIIVAASDNDVIGRQGSLPWHLPAEMAYFRKVTLGHPVIMGRKTYESIGKPLADRLNVIITSDKNYKAEGCIVVNSFEETLTLGQVRKTNEVFVIGGQSVNDQALPLANKLYLTRIHTHVEGDKFFHFNPADWQLIWSEKHAADKDNKYPFEFQVYRRKSKTA